jgi:nucleolar protein 14
LLLFCSSRLRRVKLVAPREFNPRYEEDYAAGKDYDPDRQRSEQRKLQRQLVKEKRGAMRELRCDAVFMSAVSMVDRLHPCACFIGACRSAMLTSMRRWTCM